MNKAIFLVFMTFTVMAMALEMFSPDDWEDMTPEERAAIMDEWEDMSREERREFRREFYAAFACWPPWACGKK